jgi:drug/metabolite transporter (DMT)-like permease
MVYLLLVSVLWAFSFGLIKGVLTGLDSNFVSFVRLAIALLVFLPFWRPGCVPRKTARQLMAIGAVQYGLMYITYIYSFRFLKAYEAALFTIFTPIYVTLLSDFLRRRFNLVFLVTAVMAVIGTGVIVANGAMQNDILTGFLLLQVSNLAFAFGQIFYRDVMSSAGKVSDWQVYAYPYLGGTLLTLVSTTISGGWQSLAIITSRQVLTLLYLGAIASGLCFFLWNMGARRVDVGALAIFNNLKVPLSVAVSLLVFGETANIRSLTIGGLIIVVALAINEYAVYRRARPAPAQTV